MSVSHPRPVILCVDDDTRLLDTFEGQLQRSFPGYEISPAAGGVDALRVMDELRRDGADLAMAITDQLLGDTTGTELLTRVRGYFPDAVRVIVTGHAALESAIEGVRLGIDDYLEKPVDEKELRRSLRPLLDRHRLRSEELALRRHAREAIRHMSSLLELAFRDLERPLAEVLAAGPEATQAVEELSQAQARVSFLWRLLRDEGVERAAQPDYVSARELIDEAMEVWVTADHQGLQSEDVPEATVVVRPERLALFSDRGLTRMALEQILHNAWRFAPPGTGLVIVARGPTWAAHAGDSLPPVTAPVDAQLRAGRAVVSVTNEGPLSPHHHRRILRALRPGDADGPLPGAGLVVARALLEICGGALLYEGAPGDEGATFHLALPAAGG